MGLAVFLHFITFVVAMGPSFIDGREFFTTSTNLPGVQYMWIHAVTGGVALILGIFLVIVWIIKISHLAGCYKKNYGHYSLTLVIIYNIWNFNIYIILYVKKTNF